jgi:hypothetical protein
MAPGEIAAMIFVLPFVIAFWMLCLRALWLVIRDID